MLGQRIWPLTGVEGPRLFFALYRRLVTVGTEPPVLALDRTPFRNTAVVIFEAGPLMMIPDRIAGTAAANEDIYYRWGSSGWQRLETQSWVADLAKRLPTGFGVWKGIVPDLDRMKASSAVWRDGDANCCPTGGWVCVELAYRGEILVIDRLRHDPQVNTGVCAQ